MLAPMVEQALGLVWEVLREDAIVVVYYGDHASDATWQSYYAMLESFGPSDTPRFLGYAESAPPRAVLETLVVLLRGKQWKASLVSPSSAMRFAASTFALIIRNFRFFPPEDLTGALDHLGCSAGEKLKVRDTLRRLRRSSIPG
jgi:hypothetical protein